VAFLAVGVYKLVNEGRNPHQYDGMTVERRLRSADAVDVLRASSSRASVRDLVATDMQCIAKLPVSRTESEVARTSPTSNRKSGVGVGLPSAGMLTGACGRIGWARRSS
jgi:hypothetical protein